MKMAPAVIGMLCAVMLCAAPLLAGRQGLSLAVRDSEVEAGMPVDLHWEIAPDGKSAVSIILGIILPDGDILIYGGPRRGFSPLEKLDAAPAIMTDFPYNTRMSGELEVETLREWPHGTCQFIAAVREGKTILEIVYSNSFLLY
ncbi:MAG: hypothetical protein PHN82_01015 [bacterium]|nr:hypothetical protein [bacterium]